MKISWKWLEKIVYSAYCIWINVVQKIGSNKLKSLMKLQISTYSLLGLKSLNQKKSLKQVWKVHNWN
jgi:hypothetical protein